MTPLNDEENEESKSIGWKMEKPVQVRTNEEVESVCRCKGKIFRVEGDYSEMNLEEILEGFSGK